MYDNENEDYLPHYFLQYFNKQSNFKLSNYAIMLTQAILSK